MAKLIRFFDTITKEERGITYIGDNAVPVHDKEWSYEVIDENQKMDLIELHRQQVAAKTIIKTQKEIILEAIGLTNADIEQIKKIKSIEQKVDALKP